MKWPVNLISLLLCVQVCLTSDDVRTRLKRALPGEFDKIDVPENFRKIRQIFGEHVAHLCCIKVLILIEDKIKKSTEIHTEYWVEIRDPNHQENVITPHPLFVNILDKKTGKLHSIPFQVVSNNAFKTIMISKTKKCESGRLYDSEVLKNKNNGKPEKITLKLKSTYEGEDLQPQNLFEKIQMLPEIKLNPMQIGFSYLGQDGGNILRPQGSLIPNSGLEAGSNSPGMWTSMDYKLGAPAMQSTKDIPKTMTQQGAEPNSPGMWTSMDYKIGTPAIQSTKDIPKIMTQQDAESNPPGKWISGDLGKFKIGVPAMQSTKDIPKIAAHQGPVEMISVKTKPPKYDSDITNYPQQPITKITTMKPFIQTTLIESKPMREDFSPAQQQPVLITETVNKPQQPLQPAPEDVISVKTKKPLSNPILKADYIPGEEIVANPPATLVASATATTKSFEPIVETTTTPIVMVRVNLHKETEDKKPGNLNDNNDKDIIANANPNPRDDGVESKVKEERLDALIPLPTTTEAPVKIRLNLESDNDASSLAPVPPKPTKATEERNGLVTTMYYEMQQRVPEKLPIPKNDDAKDDYMSIHSPEMNVGQEPVPDFINDAVLGKLEPTGTYTNPNGVVEKTYSTVSIKPVEQSTDYMYMSKQPEIYTPMGSSTMNNYVPRYPQLNGEVVKKPVKQYSQLPFPSDNNNGVVFKKPTIEVKEYRFPVTKYTKIYQTSPVGVRIKPVGGQFTTYQPVSDNVEGAKEDAPDETEKPHVKPQIVTQRQFIQKQPKLKFMPYKVSGKYDHDINLDEVCDGLKPRSGHLVIRITIEKEYEENGNYQIEPMEKYILISDLGLENVNVTQPAPLNIRTLLNKLATQLVVKKQHIIPERCRMGCKPINNNLVDSALKNAQKYELANEENTRNRLGFGSAELETEETLDLKNKTKNDKTKDDDPAVSDGQLRRLLGTYDDDVSEDVQVRSSFSASSSSSSSSSTLDEGPDGQKIAKEERRVIKKQFLPNEPGKVRVTERFYTRHEEMPQNQQEFSSDNIPEVHQRSFIANVNEEPMLRAHFAIDKDPNNHHTYKKANNVENSFATATKDITDPFNNQKIVQKESAVQTHTSSVRFDEQTSGDPESKLNQVQVAHILDNINKQNENLQKTINNNKEFIEPNSVLNRMFTAIFGPGQQNRKKRSLT